MDLSTRRMRELRDLAWAAWRKRDQRDQYLAELLEAVEVRVASGMGRWDLALELAEAGIGQDELGVMRGLAIRRGLVLLAEVLTVLGAEIRAAGREVRNGYRSQKSDR